MKAINIKEKLSQFPEHWHPRQIATVDDMHVLLAKVSGDFVWHQHEGEDELFQVLRGTLYLDFEDRTEEIHEGELVVVPKGVKHRPRTKKGEEVHLLLFEKITTRHTGEVSSSLTQKDYPKI